MKSHRSKKRTALAGYTAKYSCLLFTLSYQLFEIWTKPPTASLFGTMVMSAITVMALLSAAHIRCAYCRWLWAAIFALSAWFFSGYRIAMNAHMTFDVFKTMFGYRSFAGLAIAQYGPSIFWSFVLTLPLFFGVGLKPSNLHPVRFWRSLFLCAAPFLLLLALITFHNVAGDRKEHPLPGIYAPPVFTALMLYDALHNTGTVKREQIAIPHDQSAPSQDIVLIIDESISPLYLDINDPNGAYSGLAQPRDGFSIANFGIASAITHCTNATNQTIRHGGTRAEYRRLNAHGPSIFAYAKAAGFQTVYIDTQTVNGQLHNAMDETERASIDSFIQFNQTPPINRDHAAADMLRDLLNDGTFQFILVNKQGAHFPVHAAYPSDQRRYAPVASQTQYFSLEEWNPLYSFSAARKNWPQYRNAYRNTLLWNVGGFFDRLLASPLQSPATIFYTSDHGQDLHERGNIGANTHCTPWPYPEEGAVPLVVVETSGLSGPWQTLADTKHDASSHYQLFPTLLQLMHFDPSNVERRYGLPLANDAQEPMTFNILFRAREGFIPQWQKVEPEKLKRPPSSDYVADED